MLAQAVFVIAHARTGSFCPWEKQVAAQEATKRGLWRVVGELGCAHGALFFPRTSCLMKWI